MVIFGEVSPLHTSNTNSFADLLNAVTGEPTWLVAFACKFSWGGLESRSQRSSHISHAQREHSEWQLKEVPIHNMCPHKCAFCDKPLVGPSPGRLIASQQPWGAGGLALQWGP